MRVREKVAIGLLAVAIALAALFVRPYEGSWLIVTPDHVYDFVGPFRVAYTRITRACGPVIRLSAASPQWQLVRARLGQVGSHSAASPRQVLQMGHWYLAHSDFELSEPGVFLFELTPAGLADRAEWSGTAAPFRDEPAMWEHLRARAPQAPRALIECLELNGPYAGPWPFLVG